MINAISEIILSQDMPESLDATLFRFAKEQDKTIDGIETHEEQVSIIQKISLDTQRQALVKTATNLRKYRKTIVKMKHLYETYETNRLHQASKKGIGGMRKVLLYDRNIKMATRIHEKAKANSLFSAVGAGHLFGKKGVLKLLKSQGATVKPIKMNK